jgi:hypothetical protein
MQEDLAALPELCVAIHTRSESTARILIARSQWLIASRSYFIYNVAGSARMFGYV